MWCLRAHKKVSKDEPATIRGTEDAPSSATGNSFNNAPLTIDGTKGSSEREIVTKEKTVIRNTHSEENEEKDSKSKDEINGWERD